MAATGGGFLSQAAAHGRDVDCSPSNTSDRRQGGPLVRRQEAGLQVEPTLCPRCGQAHETMLHVVWECADNTGPEFDETDALKPDAPAGHTAWPCDWLRALLPAAWRPVLPRRAERQWWASRSGRAASLRPTARTGAMSRETRRAALTAVIQSCGRFGARLCKLHRRLASSASAL